ncbi:MAG: NAD-dependent protein deacylase [Bacilli bacterium]|jgi:NAD-dependent deacetylase|nr:NAD-dependent protein deacylase [Bacilli bacterium]
MDNGIQEEAKKLQALIDKSHKIVFFGGAGVSTESGIPDFRSVDGLYHQKYKYDPEIIISHGFFENSTEEFYRFYKDKMLLLDNKPNAAHFFLTKLEKAGKLKAVVTQNIDGLHQMAGTKNVIELHGSVYRNHCETCGRFFDAAFVKNSKDLVPHCPDCGGIIKPDVTLYEEPLEEMTVTRALVAISEADLLIVAGTSLVVYPAASFINYYQGDDVVLIDKDPSSSSKKATLLIHEKVGELFSLLHV